MKATDNTVEWVKIGAIKHLCLISKDVICYGTGCFLNFYNMHSGEESKLDVNFPSVNGDGVGAVAGNRCLYIFCYAENCRYPAFYVKTYPGFKTITKVKDGPPEGYSAIAFSESSLLVALGNFPHYTLTVYNWRKGEKVGELNSKLTFERQQIRCNWQMPVALSQICQNRDKLILWDLFTCCKAAVVAEHEISLPENENDLKFMDTLWTTEGGLYVLDIRGCIFFMVNEIRLEKVVHENLNGDVDPSMCWYKVGIAVCGPNKKIRHYRKSGSWECDWTIDLEKSVRNIQCNKSDYLVGVTVDEEIIKLSSTNEVVYLKQNESQFNDISQVYPAGEHFVALRRNQFLNVYETRKGLLLNTMELPHKTLVMAENPEFPYIAVGYDNGCLELISLYNPEKPTLMASFNLTKNPIATVKFFEQGRIIVAGFLDIGEFFLIEGIPGTHMKIITNIEAERQIVDYTLVASKNCYRLFLIPVTKTYLAGSEIIRYCVISRDEINIKEYTLENTKYFYHRIVASNKPNRDKMLYALPFNCRNIHILELRRGDNVIRLHSIVKSGHLLRKCNLQVTPYYGVTWGYDGFVMARDNNFEKEVGMALAHHRYLGGVKNAFVHPLGMFIISLGRDNVIACTNINQNVVNKDRERVIAETLASTKFELMFKRPTIGFKPESRFKNKTWLEVQEILNVEREEKKCAAEKAVILIEFNDIKTVLNLLVSQNINGPENEKLDLVEFFLDTALYNFKKEFNKQECKKTAIYLEALIVAQDKVSKYLMENCWDTMDVKGQLIYGMFSKSVITNFPLPPPDLEAKKKLEWVQEQRRVEQFLQVRDNFEPWLIMTDEQIAALTEPLCYKLEDADNITKLMRARIDDSQSRTVDTKIAITGSAAQLYITINNAHYDQRQIVTFHQCHLEQTIVNDDVLQLKLTFNKVFDDLVAHKQREMAVVKDRNDRLRHIISEHNYFSENKISLTIEDPRWSQSETPEKISQVSDNEMTITPYISPSEQAILDAKAAEEERIRLALLADDFKERALMAMMNGVLEVKWEDELKKDVPLPKCMTTKQPENYNEEDLRSVKEYEEKVVFLNSERERYKNLLDGEFTKVSTSVRDTIRRFNQKLKETIDYKMQIEAARNHEHLKINRLRYTELKRYQMFSRKEKLKLSIKRTEEKINNFKKTVTFLQESMTECKTGLEILLLKEKLLEKSFKKDFQDVSPILQEQAVKLYKKRPKIGYKQISFATVLFELARCIVSQEKSLLLTNDCFDYMKGLDQLDQFIGLPPMVDENTYNHICKHRRLRIEFEIKVKAFQSELLEGEATIATFQKRLNVNKEMLVKLSAELQHLRVEYHILQQNIQTQIVLRRGLVELPLTGSMSDFDDAILVPKKEIEDINKLILEAGNKKIQTITQNMAFRRHIMETEWEHRKQRMIINDLIEQLTDIESVRLGKDMQQYLKAKALGRKTEQDSFEVEIERIGGDYEIRIQKKKEKFSKINKMIQVYRKSNMALDKQINALNVDVCHLQMLKDQELQGQEQDVLKARMEGLLKRTHLVEQIQKNHNEILVLQTELELLRLRTYPTFKYKLINPN